MTYIKSDAQSGRHALVRVAALLAALIVGLLVAGAGSAQADHSPLNVNEGFERMHSDLRFFHVGNGSGGNVVINQTPVPVLNPQRARTGVGHAYLWTRPDSSSRVTPQSIVERIIRKRADQLSCSASAYVNPEGSTKTVYFQAFDPATPTAPFLRSVRLTLSGSGYQRISLGSFSSYLTNMGVRVGLLHGGSAGAETLRVDDLTVTCRDFH
jgi:hypothetical protein